MAATEYPQPPPATGTEYSTAIAGTFRFFHYLHKAAAATIHTKPAGRTEMAQVCKIVCEWYKLPHREKKPRKSKEKRVYGGQAARQPQRT